MLLIMELMGLIMQRDYLVNKDTICILDQIMIYKDYQGCVMKGEC